MLDAQTPEASSFLEVLERDFKRTISVVRCDTRDHAAASQWNRGSAALLSSEEDAAALAATLNRESRLRNWMAEPAIKKMLVSIHKLPTLPKIHAQLTQELRNPNSSMDAVARLIAQDPVIAAKMLQVANSTGFGLAYEVSDPLEAVMVLGAERTRALLLLESLFSQFDGSTCAGFSPEPLWAHSLQVGSLARTIALAETKNTKLAETAFTAGLLHDIGKLILAGNLPQMFQGIRRLQALRKQSELEAELELMGSTHAELGACLLGTWGLPLPILEAIAWHHFPARSEDTAFSVLTAVHFADVAAHELSGERAQTGLPVKMDCAYLLHLGLIRRCNQWREACGLPPRLEQDLGQDFEARQEGQEN